VLAFFISFRFYDKSDLRKKIETGGYMATLNQSKIPLSELMETRRKIANLGGVAVSSEEKKTPSRQAMDKLLEQTLRKAGLNLDKVEELRKQSESEMLERMAKRTAEPTSWMPLERTWRAEPLRIGIIRWCNLQH